MVEYVIFFYFFEFDIFQVFLIFYWLLSEGINRVVIVLVFDFIFDYVVKLLVECGFYVDESVQFFVCGVIVYGFVVFFLIFIFEQEMIL